MKRICILLFALSLSYGANAQACLPEGITFTTQSQINNFQSNFPGCREIGGDVIISGYTITNLNGLSVLKSIGGSLKIECNDALENASGLNNLEFIGGDIFIEGNMGLASLDGLQHVLSVGGDVQITNNVALMNLSGLDGLTYLNGKLWIDDNSSLTSLTGLDNVSAVANCVLIFSNTLLGNLDGLENLTVIGGKLAIGGIDHEGGMGNSSLTSLMALNNLTAIGGDLTIGYNPVLTSLDGLDNISGGSIQGLSIFNNYMLSDCEIASVCDYLSAPAGTVNISNNAPGCNSPEELEDGCLLISTRVKREPDKFSAYPNPVSDYITIETPENKPPQHFSMFDLRGPELITGFTTGNKTQISLAGLPDGIYLLRILSDRGITTILVIKQKNR